MSTTKEFDRLSSALPVQAIGIGIGPANLSLAALAEPLTDFRMRFFDRREGFEWHPGLLFEDADVQVSYIKDLVTLADPTSRFSFLAFLHAQKRLYSFFNAAFPRVRRREFNQYYQWACERLPDLEFDTAVEAVSCDDRLQVHASSGTYTTPHLVLATGKRARVPAWAAPHLGRATPHLGSSVFHASRYLDHRAVTAGRRVAVVGGGQTGAEVVTDLLGGSAAPRSITWLSRRLNFLPLDETPFTNEWFTPAYSEHFFGLGKGRRQHLLAEQKLASDGISPALTEALYQRLYESRYLADGEGEGAARWRLCPAREVLELEPIAEGWRLHVRHLDSDRTEIFDAELVILATGYEFRLPEILQPIAHRLDVDEDGFIFEDDFSIRWDAPPDCRIWVQGAATAARGLADHNLSLNAWRSARILNSMLGREVYPVETPAAMVDWGFEEAPAHLDLHPVAAGD